MPVEAPRQQYASNRPGYKKTAPSKTSYAWNSDRKEKPSRTGKAGYSASIDTTGSRKPISDQLLYNTARQERSTKLGSKLNSSVNYNSNQQQSF